MKDQGRSAAVSNPMTLRTITCRRMLWATGHSSNSTTTVGREALEKMSGRPQRRKVTFAWNAQDVLRVFASMFEGGEIYKYIDLPLSNYTSASYDKVLLQGETVGISMFAGYSYNERSMLSLGVVDPDIDTGTEVRLVWGEAGGGTKKLRSRGTNRQRFVPSSARCLIPKSRARHMPRGGVAFKFDGSASTTARHQSNPSFS